MSEPIITVEITLSRERMDFIQRIADEAGLSLSDTLQRMLGNYIARYSAEKFLNGDESPEEVAAAYREAGAAVYFLDPEAK